MSKATAFAPAPVRPPISCPQTGPKNVRGRLANSGASRLCGSTATTATWAADGGFGSSFARTARALSKSRPSSQTGFGAKSDRSAAATAQAAHTKAAIPLVSRTSG
ncbi:MAG: hypothetical protein OXT01_21680 [Rhodospirillaceae bacterium]|nr:hypothetical protein [Rhodospirillaceae bacterium]